MTAFADKILPVVSESLKESVSVSALVLLVMAVVELLNLFSVSRLFKRIHGRPLVGILLACALGAIPGCAGGFIIVTMFSQGIVPFSALCAGMVATFGDEAIYLFAQNPKIALILTAILFLIGTLSGVVVHKFSKSDNRSSEKCCSHEKCHEHHNETFEQRSFKEKMVHFLYEHCWNHIIKEHALKIFLYIFVTLFVVGIANLFLDLDSLLQGGGIAVWITLLVAVLVGFLPVSGPNLIFVILFLQGMLPFGILLANSVSQNGHAGIPLLAHSRRSFIIVKILTLVVGFLAGGICLLNF